MTLLEKTRLMNKLLQGFGEQPVSFYKLAEILRDLIDSSVFILSRKGKILGASTYEQIEKSRSRNDFLELYHDKIIKIQDVTSNILNGNDLTAFNNELCSSSEKGWTTVVPVHGTRNRLGSLIFARTSSPFVDDDLILMEFLATIVGMEIMRGKLEEVEEEKRNLAVVKLAINSLSFSELEAAGNVLEEISGSEGLLVASKIADRAGITRSVIVNTLRKLEGAGVIESRSLGMKGTHIRIINESLIPELKKAKFVK